MVDDFRLIIIVATVIVKVIVTSVIIVTTSFVSLQPLILIDFAHGFCTRCDWFFLCNFLIFFAEGLHEGLVLSQRIKFRNLEKH